MYGFLPKVTLVLTAWHICLASAAVKHGIIGMGINMYKPFCCNACTDSLSSLFLNCTVVTDGLGTTSPACRASNEPWLQTLAYCFEQECGIDGLSTAEIQTCWSNMADTDLSSYEDSIPAKSPTIEVSADAVWLNTSSLVNKKLYRTTRLSYQEWEFEEDMHSRLAVSIIGIAFGFCLIVGLFRITVANIEPSDRLRQVSVYLSKYLMTPALCGSRHLVPLPYNLGYLPSRFLSLVIFVYVCINIVFSLLPIHNPWPSIGYATPRAEIAAYFSNRAGVLSFANIVLAILFAGRNNPLMYLAGFSYTSCITFHRYASRVATIQAVIHSILFTITYFWSGGFSAYSAEAAKAYYWWGIIATIALALGVAFAILPLRLRHYEVFLITHIGFAVLALVACWYHIIKRYEKKWGYEVYLYIAFAFWGFDRLIRLVRITIYSWIGGSSQAYAELLPGNDLVKLTVFPSTAWSFQPGQHSFLYFPSVGKGYESHPFSIASWTNCSRDVSSIMDLEKAPEAKGGAKVTFDPNPGLHNSASSSKESLSKPSITFIIRPSTGITLKLRDYVISHSSSDDLQTHIPLPIRVLLEGPYGHGAPLHNADAILCIAGGVGITAILGYLQAFVAERPKGTRRAIKAERMLVAWSARQGGFTDRVKELIPADAEARGIELRFTCTGTGGEENERLRIDISQMIQAEAQAVGKKKLAIISCGPAGMADDVRREVASCVRRGYRIDLFEEAFAW